MSVHAIAYVLEHSEATLGARLVMIVLADHAQKDGTRAFPSVETIARDARLSERAARAALRRLEESGEIVRTGTSKYGTNVYRIAGMQGGEVTSGGEDDDARGGKFATETVSPTSPDPSSNPSSNPSEEIAPGAPSPLFPGAAEEVLEFYRETFDLNGSTKLTKARASRINARLTDGRTVDELKLAIRSCAESEWHVTNGQIELAQILHPEKIGRHLARAKAKGITATPADVLRRERDGVPELSSDGGKTWETDYETAIQRRRERANG